LGLPLIAALGIIFSFELSAQSQEAASGGNGASKKLPIVILPEMGDFQFAALGDLAELLDLRTFYSEKARKVILYVGNNELKVTAMNPFVQVNDRLVQLPLETRFANGDILVPVPYFTELVRPLYSNRWPEQLEFPKTAEHSAANNVSVATTTPVAPVEPALKSTAPANIAKILVEEKANGTLIRLQTSRPFARKQVNTRVSQKWLYIDIVGARLDSGAARHLRPAGIVQRVVPMYAGAVAQISCQLKEDIDQKRIIVSGAGNEILISLPTLDQLSTDVLPISKPSAANG
jgi:hypothetical protein